MPPVAIAAAEHDVARECGVVISHCGNTNTNKLNKSVFTCNSNQKLEKFKSSNPQHLAGYKSSTNDPTADEYNVATNDIDSLCETLRLSASRMEQKTPKMDQNQGRTINRSRRYSSTRSITKLDVLSAVIANSNSRSFVVYQVVATGEVRFEAFRRYSQFLDLHLKLSQRHTMPRLPGKKFIGNQTKRFIERRRKELNGYLDKLIGTDVLQDQDFMSFLGINNETEEDAKTMTSFKWATRGLKKV